MSKKINDNQAAKTQIVSELHSPARKNYPRRVTALKGLKDLFQADLIEMQDYRSYNDGYRYIMVVICCFSKYVWAFPLKNKTALSVANAMEKLLLQGKVPKNIQTDHGSEFYNKTFKKLMNKYLINHYSSYTIMKAAIVERVIRTLKEKIYKQFSLQGSYEWVKNLDSIVRKYNNTKHRTINMKPSEVNRKNEKHLLSTVFSHMKILGKHKFTNGDIVRISKQKRIFDKGYLPNWGTEEFKITRVKLTTPVTYLLEDYEGQPILGSFYEHELKKVSLPGYYLVEKVLKRTARKSLVRWLGFSSRHDSWINNK